MMGKQKTVVADDGFFFGVGAFETIALEQGVPLFFAEHIARLMATLECLGISATREEIVALAREACENDRTQASDAVQVAAATRAGVTASAEGAASDVVRQKAVALSARRVLKLTVTKKNRLATLRDNTYTDEALNRGFLCEFADVRRNETSPLTAMKTLNYSDCILQKRAFAARGIDEPLFLNTQGQVAEGATTNVFAVIDGVVVTPPVQCGLLPGVMRAFVLQVLRGMRESQEQTLRELQESQMLQPQDQGSQERARKPHEMQGFALSVQERIIMPGDLERASEIFLTNSLMGAMPVCQLGKNSFACGAVAAKINEAYREQVRATCARWKECEDPWAQLCLS